MFDEDLTPPARPPRKLIVTFWLDDREKWELARAAKRAGRTLSSYIRFAVGASIARDRKETR